MAGRTGTTEVLSHPLVSQLGTERLSREETVPGSTAGSSVTRLWVCGLVGGLLPGRRGPAPPLLSLFRGGQRWGRPSL